MSLPSSSIFESLVNPRYQRNQHHRLTDILIIAVCGVLSGPETWEGITVYGRAKEALFRRFLPLANGIPSQETFLRVYSVSSKHKTTPEDAVRDAKSAVRYIREHAKALGIATDRLVVAGGSAGGHLAACTTLVPGYLDEKGATDADVTAKPVIDQVYSFEQAREVYEHLARGGRSEK